MKTKLLFTIAALLSAALSFAGITSDEPVVQMSGGVPSELRLGGRNTENNWQYVIEKYGDEGVQLQLVISRIDTSKPAQITSEDIADPNYWETTFGDLTYQYVGMRMEVANNIKKLVINDVAVQPGQFAAYARDTKYVYITSAGDYTIPDNLFNNTNIDNFKIKEFYCNVAGTMTIGSTVFPTSSSTMKIFTTSETVAQQWYEYKNTNQMGYTVYLNGSSYNPQGVDEKVIRSAQFKLTAGNFSRTYQLSETGFQRDNMPNSVSDITISDILVETGFHTNTPTWLVYKVVGENNDYDSGYNTIYLSTQDGYTWTFNNSNCSLLNNLNLRDGSYILKFHIEAVTENSEMVLWTNGKDNDKDYNRYCFGFTYGNGGGQQGVSINSVTINLSETTGILSGGFRVPNNDGVVDAQMYNISKFRFNGFSATTTGQDASQLSMEYSIYPESEFGNSHDRTSIDASINEKTGAWSVSDYDINLLEGLQPSTTYYLEVQWKAQAKSTGNVTYYPSNGEPIYIKFTTSNLGDVNHDGSITMADANVVVNYYLVPTEGFDFDAADVNDDGQITMADANQIVNMYLNAGK